MARARAAAEWAEEAAASAASFVTAPPARPTAPIAVVALQRAGSARQPTVAVDRRDAALGDAAAEQDRADRGEACGCAGRAAGEVGAVDRAAADARDRHGTRADRDPGAAAATRRGSENGSSRGVGAFTASPASADRQRPAEALPARDPERRHGAHERCTRQRRRHGSRDRDAARGCKRRETSRGEGPLVRRVVSVVAIVGIMELRWRHATGGRAESAGGRREQSRERREGSRPGDLRDRRARTQHRRPDGVARRAAGGLRAARHRQPRVAGRCARHAPEADRSEGEANAALHLRPIESARRRAVAWRALGVGVRRRRSRRPGGRDDVDPVER